MVYDACVLYPAPLRDTLVSIAATRLIRAHWTEQIHREWIRNVLKDRPDIPPDQLDRTRRLMNRAVPDPIVEGYEHIIETLILPDLDDRHVVAAAIQAKADLIVTFNLADFPDEALSQYALQACTPDAFVTKLLEQSPLTVIEALRKQRARLRNPEQSPDQFLATLARQGLSQSVETLKPHAAHL